MTMCGYFGVGVEEISKPGNVGNLVRLTHAFGGSFMFFINPQVDVQEVKVSDTSNASGHMPHYIYNSVQDMQLPQDCTLVGIELTEDAIELPSFRHSLRARPMSLAPKWARFPGDAGEVQFCRAHSHQFLH